MCSCGACTITIKRMCILTILTLESTNWQYLCHMCSIVFWTSNLNFNTYSITCRKNMYCMFFICSEERLHLFGRCPVCCTDFLCNVFVPSRSIVHGTLCNGSVNEGMHIYIHADKITTWSKWREESVFFNKGMLPIDQEYIFASGLLHPLDVRAFL